MDIAGRRLYYKLGRAHEVLPASREELIALYEGDFDTTRLVGRDDVDAQRVSTVFLVMDHGYGNDPPLVFETMIFGGSHDESQWRYGTWGEAKAGHRRVVKALRAGKDPNEL